VLRWLPRWGRHSTGASKEEKGRYNALSPAGDGSGGRHSLDRRRDGGSTGVRKQHGTAVMAPVPCPHRHHGTTASPAILARAPAPRAPPLRFPSGLEPPHPLLSGTHWSHRRWQQKWWTGARGIDGEAEMAARRGGGSGGPARGPEGVAAMEVWWSSAREKEGAL
jgi:hypothetical protein